MDGQFSMPFCAAVVLSEGNLVWDDYPTHLKNSSTLDLCRKVRTLVDERAESVFPREMSGSVNLKTSRGDFQTFIEVPKGEPGNFMSEEEFRNKFDGLCQPSESKQKGGILRLTAWTGEGRRSGFGLFNEHNGRNLKW